MKTLDADDQGLAYAAAFIYVFFFYQDVLLRISFARETWSRF